jgi:predicted Na+-dependent transporter
MESGTLAAPVATAAFTFDDGDVVVPYMIVQGANADSAIHLKSMKVTRSPGVQYQD